MRLPAVRALALATLLVLTHVPASALLQRHAGDERRGTVSGHVVTSPLQLRDLELNFPVHKLGQIVLGAIIG